MRNLVYVESGCFYQGKSAIVLLHGKYFVCLCGWSSSNEEWLVPVTFFGLMFVGVFTIQMFSLRRPTRGGKSPLRNHCMLYLLKSPIKWIAVNVTVE